MGRMMGSILSKYQKIPINKQKWLPFGSLQGVFVTQKKDETNTSSLFFKNTKSLNLPYKNY